MGWFSDKRAKSKPSENDREQTVPQSITISAHAAEIIIQSAAVRSASIDGGVREGFDFEETPSGYVIREKPSGNSAGVRISSSGDGIKTTGGKLEITGGIAFGHGAVAMGAGSIIHNNGGRTIVVGGNASHPIVTLNIPHGWNVKAKLTGGAQLKTQRVDFNSAVIDLTGTASAVMIGAVDDLTVNASDNANLVHIGRRRRVSQSKAGNANIILG